MKNTFLFVPATDNYKILSGTYDFLICKHENSEDNRTIQIKCKRLKTALNKIMDMVDYNEETIDYEVAVKGHNTTTFININRLPKGHPIHAYLS